MKKVNLFIIAFFLMSSFISATGYSSIEDELVGKWRLFSGDVDSTLLEFLDDGTVIERGEGYSDSCQWTIEDGDYYYLLKLNSIENEGIDMEEKEYFISIKDDKLYIIYRGEEQVFARVLKGEKYGYETTTN